MLHITLNLLSACIINTKNYTNFRRKVGHRSSPIYCARQLLPQVPSVTVGVVERWLIPEARSYFLSCLAGEWRSSLRQWYITMTSWLLMSLIIVILSLIISNSCNAVVQGFELYPHLAVHFLDVKMFTTSEGCTLTSGQGVLHLLWRTPEGQPLIRPSRTYFRGMRSCFSSLITRVNYN